MNTLKILTTSNRRYLSTIGLVIFIVITFSSCSINIQKRKFLNGYSISIKPINNKSIDLNDKSYSTSQISGEIIDPDIVTNCGENKFFYFDTPNLESNLHTFSSIPEEKKVSRKVLVFENSTDTVLSEKEAKKTELRKSIKNIGKIAGISLLGFIISALVLSIIALTFFEILFVMSILALTVCFFMLLLVILRRIFYKKRKGNKFQLLIALLVLIPLPVLIFYLIFF